jgi:exosortase/archaeosortase family protein
MSIRNPNKGADKKDDVSREGWSPYHSIIFSAAIIFLLLPFIGMFNDVLTKIVMNFQIYIFIENVVVPIEARMVGVVLQYCFGIQTTVFGSALFLHGWGHSANLQIAWNCVGWQSLILLIITFVTGLRGQFTPTSKVICILLGLEGIFLVNLFRIASVCLIGFYWGYLPAVIFHDYGGIVLILVWLVIFWYFSFKYVLRPSKI